MRNEFVALSIITTVLIIILSTYISSFFWWLFLIAGPILVMGYYDFFQTRHTIRRNFPLLGRARYIAEELRPKVYQYFVESNTEGRPYSRMFRSIIYQRAKQVLDTSPFGTQSEVYSEGYEWMNHSIAALNPHDLEKDPRVTIGGPQCKFPYKASIFNVSAMSFGSLSKKAIASLNGGAAIGHFAQNTGEGGISPYHLRFGGDLIFQFGTGYFGCRDEEGYFSPIEFAKKAKIPSVKMIELKLSQGAKPGHGGILPAKKVTTEIADIRNIEPFIDVISPPHHTVFGTPLELIQFISKLRDLSGGKPVGFKLCVGHPVEFIAICKAMVETGITPDFITVDGGEGGTGAAPLEFSNSVGMPLRDGLAFVYNALNGFDLKTHIKLIASGKVATGFHIFRSLALGADLCASARAMMMAVGCVQALQCNQNTCPTGVATQNKELMKGLVIDDKKVRVANYHRETVESFVELMAAAGLNHPAKINRSHVFRRIIMNKTQSYSEIYPNIFKGCLLNLNRIPVGWKSMVEQADPNHF